MSILYMGVYEIALIHEMISRMAVKSPFLNIMTKKDMRSIDGI